MKRKKYEEIEEMMKLAKKYGEVKKMKMDEGDSQTKLFLLNTKKKKT